MRKEKEEHLKALQIILEHEQREWLLRALKEEIRQIREEE